MDESCFCRALFAGDHLHLPGLLRLTRLVFVDPGAGEMPAGSSCRCSRAHGF